MDLEQIIKESFLSPESKSGLLAYLKTNGSNQTFMDMLKSELSKEIQSRQGRTEEFFATVDTKANQFQESFAQAKAAITKDTEDKLSQIDSNDDSAKKTVWEEHYTQLEKLTEDSTNEIKKMSAIMLGSLLN